MIADFSAALTKITDQFLTRFQLFAPRLIAIEIANQANSEGDVVQVIAMDVATIDLPAPAIADFDLAIAGGSAIADHEMISESILHSAKMPVVIVECSGVALTCSAIVHNDVLPAAPRDRRAIYLSAHGARQVTVTGAAAGAPSVTTAK